MNFMVGCAVGSFLNLVALRLPHSEPILTGRSCCPNCHHVLRWSDLIPLLSWFLLRGKCRYCHQPISSRYWIVELLTGVLFVYVAVHMSATGDSWWRIWDHWLWIAIGVLVSLMDWQEQVVYPIVLVIGVGLHIGIVWLVEQSLLSNQQLIAVVVGVALYGGIYVIGYAICRKEVFGLGDIYYLMTISLWLTPTEVLLIGLLAFVLGGGVMLLSRLLHQTLEREIAFIPYIFAAQLLVYSLGTEWFGF